VRTLPLLRVPGLGVCASQERSVRAWLCASLAGALIAAGGCAADPLASSFTGTQDPSTDTPGGEGDGDNAGNGDDNGGPDNNGGNTDGPWNNGGDNGGSGSDPNGDECAVIKRESPEGRGGVDVVFLLDTSGSMLHATTQVINNLAKFMQEFQGTNADVRVVMITGSDPANGTPVAGDSSRYRFIRSQVDSKALYTVALEKYPQYQDFLRPNAATQFVMITDDNDRIDGAQFRQEMEQRLGRKITQHAIASEATASGTACYSEAQLWNPLCMTAPLPPIPAVCGAAAIGKRYYDLAAATGGVTASICKEDWGDIFAKLKEAVIEAVPLPCDYPLADASSDEFDADKVQVKYRKGSTPESQFPRATEQPQCGDRTGWYYDDNDAPTTIHLCPAACSAVQEGGSIDLVFGCKPDVIF
jgi:hypothetical protein